MAMRPSHLDRRNSISEPNLNTATDNIRNEAGFPPGTTVDELRLYRKKRHTVTYPGDHLSLRQGSFKLLKTEYKRRFRKYQEDELSPVHAIRPDNLLKIEGAFDFHPEYNEKYVEFPLEKRRHLFDAVNDEMSDNNTPRENLSSSAPILNEPSNYEPTWAKRVPPLRRSSTHLKLEGEQSMQTESAAQFVEYLQHERARFVKRATTLRLEGDMDTKTESREQFVALPPQHRPPLCKKFTNLHLEGDLNVVSETRSNFRAHNVEKRPPLTKKTTNLHVEGDIELLPEYRREFVEYNQAERPKLVLPVNHLRADGSYHDNGNGKFDRIHPQIPFLRNEPTVNYSATRRRPEMMTENRSQFVDKSARRPEKIPLNNQLYMEGQIELTPEYRNAYIDFSGNGGTSTPVRSRRALRQVDQLTISRERMDSMPEYRGAYVDFPRQRPRVKKPESSFSSEGEMEHLTEKSAQYIAHPNAPRSNSLKREPELRLEGEIECQPEYRKAYINYLIRERSERMPRPIDNLGTTARRVFEDASSMKTTVVDIHPTKEETNSAPPGANFTFVAKVTPPSPRPSTPRSLAQIENSVFGPRLETPKKKQQHKNTSRSATPTPSGGRRQSQSNVQKPQSISQKPQSTCQKSQQINHQASAGESPTSDSDVSSKRNSSNKTFGDRVRVENLATSRSTTPVLPLVDVNKRNRWMRRDSSMESINSAFVVLDNNRIGGSLTNIGRRGRRKERWPTWYENG